RITSVGFADLLPEDSAFYASNNISVQNHSYGVGVESYYGVEAAAYDEVLHQMPVLVAVFSAGNSGLSSTDDGLYQGLPGVATLTGNFKQAKNALVVTAIDTANNSSLFNSRGPAYDGRIKPELAAFGGEGTSDAAAIASGCAILVQQRYKAMSGEAASSSLVKSALIAGAVDVGLPGVDFITGFGGINLSNTIELMDKEWLGDVDLIEHDSAGVRLFIPEGSGGIRLAVSWTDPPASPGDFEALINDIDVVLKNLETGEMWKPWVLQVVPDTGALSRPAERASDHLNNIEFISIDHPPAGDYVLWFKSKELKYGSQIVSYAYHVDESDQLKWLSPAPDSKVLAESIGYVRWHSNIADGSASLYIKYGESDWLLAAGQVNLSKGFARVAFKDTAEIATFKLVTLKGEFVSEEFSVSPQSDLDVVFDCPGEVLLSWVPQPSALSYSVFLLDQNRKKELVNTADTFMLVRSPISSNYFSVRANFDGFSGREGYMINYKEQKSGCYFNKFSAILDQGQVELAVQLTSVFELKNVRFFRERNGMVELLSEKNVQTSLDYFFIDDRPMQGLNQYFAQLTRLDGQVINSELLPVFSSGNQPVLVFPNPLLTGTPLAVLVEQSGASFQLFDNLGRLLFEEELREGYDEIYINYLAGGVYPYRVINDKEYLFSGRLVIE
ncbi:MAG: S8 family peptidase, partial [Imperialibacter sp.]